MDKEQKINEEFDKMLSEMSEEEFWNWLKDWYDPQNAIDEARQWDTHLKEGVIDEYKNGDFTCEGMQERLDEAKCTSCGEVGTVREVEEHDCKCFNS